jgi:hypothetical protein
LVGFVFVRFDFAAVCSCITFPVRDFVCSVYSGFLRITFSPDISTQRPFVSEEEEHSIITENLSNLQMKWPQTQGEADTDEQVRISEMNVLHKVWYVYGCPCEHTHLDLEMPFIPLYALDMLFVPL